MEKVVSLDKRPDGGTILFQVVTMLLIVLGCTLIFSYIGFFVATELTGAKLNDIAALNENSSAAVVEANKIIQLISVIGIFLLPAIIVPLLIFKASPIHFLSLNRRTPLMLFIMALLAYFALIPLLEWTIKLNQEMHLPASLKALEDTMRSMEDRAGLATKKFLEMPKTSTFIFNIFLIALLPAIAEELFFRGMVQRTMFNWTRNIHLSIILTAILFSFMHFQFFGFLPRMLLGMLLGYLLYWSGDIRLPIFIHFTNNFSAVLASYISQKNHTDIDPDNMTLNPMLITFSILLGGFLLYLVYKGGLRKKQERFDMAEGSSALPANDIKWVKIYKTDKPYMAEIITGNLKNEGIDAVSINKKDSSYTIFGFIEIYVPEEQEERARALVDSTVSGE
jgi:membrane protease YdiL (CAAX protease family)